ncbi:MAG: DHA2 family efflux MFS transporter permease subunit [Mycobacteriales bacterium]
MADAPEVAYGSPAGRWILLATVLGSGVAFLDGTIVNVALPRIGTDLSAGFSALQWVLDGYLLTLGSLVLVGGALGDLYGRRRIFVTGLVCFGLASVGCGLAPSAGVLIGARAVQGAAAALLVPGSLAILSSAYGPADRGRAIGAWSGLAGIAGALGPFVGGYLVDAASWRWAFLINVPLIAVAVAVAVRHVPETRDPAYDGMPALERLDLPGAVTGAAGLALCVYPLIEAGRLSGAAMAVLLAAGVACLGAFVLVEGRRRHPMLPLGLFRSRAFTVANLVTFVVYGALGGALFLVSIELQTQLGYSALESGAALIPVTVLLLAFSSRVGGLMSRTGARPLLTAGPLLASAGLVLMVRIAPGATYLTGVLPGIVVFGLGMTLVVAPITSTALGAVDANRSGVASGVNNAVARVAALLAVALLPLAAGLAGDPRGSFTDGVHRALLMAAALCGGGGLLALVGLPSIHRSARCATVAGVHAADSVQV